MGSCEVIISSQIQSVEEWRRAGGSSEGQETRSIFLARSFVFPYDIYCSSNKHDYHIETIMSTKNQLKLSLAARELYEEKQRCEFQGSQDQRGVRSTHPIVPCLQPPPLLFQSSV